MLYEKLRKVHLKQDKMTSVGIKTIQDVQDFTGKKM